MTLFFLQPFRSHYYPAFKLGHQLADKGEQVIFTTTPYVTEMMEQNGFEHHEMKYLSEFTINNSRVFLGILLKNLVSDNLLNERKQEFENSNNTIQALIETHKPTRIYLDQCMADYCYFFKPFVDDIIILHTRFYSAKTTGIPPMNSTYIPKNTPCSKLICEWKWYQQLTKQYFKELLLKIAFLGKDEIYFWKQHCKKHGMNWRQQSDFKHFLNRGVKNVKNIVLAPEALEFTNFKAPKNMVFFGDLSKKDESAYFSEKYMQLKNHLLKKKNTKVIYLAFGSLSFGQKKIEVFFNQVISVVAEFENTLLIVSKGNTQLQLFEAQNTIVFDFVPQLDVLLFTNVFITHGGLGSVKEAFHSQVPMLVVPLNKKIDQPGNAARVKASGLGDILDIDSYSRKELTTKLNRLLKRKDYAVKKVEVEIEPVASF